MSEEYKLRNINLNKLADFVRTNGGLDETPVLHLLDTIRVMRGRMPEQMQDCTIVFEECEKGHGSLRGTNWIKQGCQQCRIDELERQLEERYGQRDEALDLWMNQCAEARLENQNLKKALELECSNQQTRLNDVRESATIEASSKIDQLQAQNAKLVEALTTIKTNDTSTAGVMGTLAEIADEALKGVQP